MNEFEIWASGPEFGLTAAHFVKNEAGGYLNYPTQCYFEVWTAARKRDVQTAQFLTDVITAAGMIAHGKQDKKFAQRLADEAARLQLPATTCPGHGRSECVSCCWPKATWSGLEVPPVGLPVEAYFPQDTQPVWLETTLLYVSDENVIYDEPGHGEIRKTRADFDDLKVQFRAVQR